jgi:hypothetical protein
MPSLMLPKEFVGLWADKLLRQNRLLENAKKGHENTDSTPLSSPIAGQQCIFC